jgi:hypothetical protein
LFSGKDRSGLTHHKTKTDPVPSALLGKRRDDNKPILNTQPAFVWRFEQVAWLIIGLQRLEAKLVAIRNGSESERITKSAMKVGRFWSPLPASTPEVESDSVTTDPDSSKVPENPASPPDRKVPISDPVPDQVISSLFGNESPSKIAAMFSSANPRVPETPMKPEKQSPDDDSDEVSSEMPTTHSRQTLFSKFASNTSRKRRPASQAISSHSS